MCDEESIKKIYVCVWIATGYIALNHKQLMKSFNIVFIIINNKNNELFNIF